MSAAPWLFAYGSLIWRPGFEVVERRRGYISGYERRFWQASIDHRGTPEAPGRVVTLVPRAGARCWGVAYRLSDEGMQQVLAELDHREKGGYERIGVGFYGDGARRPLRVMTYFAGPQNPNYVGPESLEAIARRVTSCVGPSGPNREYVLSLARSLTELGVDDEHVRTLAQLLERSPAEEP